MPALTRRGLGKDSRDAAEVGFARVFAAFDPNETSGRYGPYTSVKRVRVGNVSPKEKANVPGGVRTGIDAPARLQCLDLRGRAKGFAVIRIVERLDAVGVTS